MKIKTIEELNKMTTREIAEDARQVMNQVGLVEATELLKNHIVIVNKKMEDFTRKLNKQMGMNRRAPKVNTITQFLKFK